MKEGGEISLDAILVAYLDGELEPEAHEKLERLLKSDPSVRERLAMLTPHAKRAVAKFLPGGYYFWGWLYKGVETLPQEPSDLP